MTEPVGLAVSVLALAQTAWTVAKGLHDLANEVGSAGEAVRVFASDFWAFVQTVKTLAELLDDLPSVPTRTKSTTEELLEVAMEEVVEPFQRLLTDLEPLLIRWRDSPSRMMQLGVRIQWAFSYKSKVLFYHTALNALKGNVSLLLHAMTLQGQNPPHVRFILCKSIEDTKISLQGISRSRAPRLLGSAAERAIDGRLIMSSPGHASAFLERSGAIPARPSSRFQDQHQHSGQTAMVLVTNADDPEDAEEVAESLIGITLLEADSADDIEQDQEEQEEQLEAYGAIRAAFEDFHGPVVRHQVPSCAGVFRVLDFDGFLDQFFRFELERLR